MSEYGSGVKLLPMISPMMVEALQESIPVQTGAQKIMGIEVGPDNHLYYVDNGRDQVVRIDSYYDIDADGVLDEDDNCLEVFNPGQENHDSDSYGDACDTDDDNDSVLDE